MVSFDDLPNELLCHIAQLILPDDIESYGRTNRRVRVLAEPVIQEHRRLRKEYTKVSLNHVAAATMLYQICARPRIMLYPRTLEIKVNQNWRSFDKPRTKREAEQLVAVARSRKLVEEERLRDLLHETGLIQAHDIGKWIRRIHYGDDDSLFALMLACLPNLQRFILRPDHTKLEQVKEMVRAIEKQPVSANHPKPLSKLTDARVLDSEGSDVCDLEMFPLLASLPGIQILHGRNLIGIYRDCWRDGWMTYPGASKTITHIYLETCGMTPEGLQTLCKTIKGLRSFKYQAHRSGWGLHRISDLLSNAQSTLEELAISAGSGTGRFAGPLRSFTKLRHLEIDSDMLIKDGKIARAVDVLPASIETATLTGNGLNQKLEQEFLGDLYRPSYYYPTLRRLSVDDSWGKRDIGKERLNFQKEFHKQASSSFMLPYR